MSDGSVIDWPLERVAAIPVADEGFSYHAASVSNSAAGLFLYVQTDAAAQVVERESEQGGASFPKPKMAEGKTFRLKVVSPDDESTYQIDGVDLAFPMFDIFPDGRICIVGARSQWRSENDYDLNGMTFDPATGIRSKFLLGDGIQNTYVDNLGRIWVSYFDEGIFGNYGWGNPGPAGLGTSGLNCFRADGDLLWRFEAPDNDRLISDCYALNISGSEAHAHYYTEFPLCRVSKRFETSYWDTSLGGCHTMAISDSGVVFSGQYSDPRSRFYFFKKQSGGRLSEPRKLQAKLLSDSDLRDATLVGRGSYIHFFVNGDWYRGDVWTAEAATHRL